MSFRRVACSGLTVLALLSAPLFARAECVRLPAKVMAMRVLEDKHFEVVFSGKVVAVTRVAEAGYRATFAVDRVWKGTVTTRFDLYVWELSSELPRFEVGQQHLALARRLMTSRELDGVGLQHTDAVAFTPVQCSDSPSLDPDLIRHLGAGLPPKN